MYVFESKRLLRSLWSWSIILALVLTLFMAFFPSMSNIAMAELAKAKINAIPPAVREALGITRLTDFSDLLQYFAYIVQYVLMAACIYAATLGASALIKEENEGTIEFLYAQPVSRLKIAVTKFLSILTVLIALNLILFLVSLILFQILRKPGYEYLPMLLAIFKGMLGGQLVFLALGFALSSVLPHSSQGASPALGLFFTSYLVGDLALINKRVEWLKYLSPYHYVQPSTILNSDGAIKPVYVVLIWLITLVAISFACWRYHRKDLLT